MNDNKDAWSLIPDDINVSVEVTALSPDITSGNKLHEWMCQQATRHALRWALLIMDGGIRWGFFEQTENQSDQETTTTLHLPSEALCEAVAINPAGLTPQTLQQAFLFGPDAEVYLWRDQAMQLQVRTTRDGGANDDDICYMSNDQVLVAGGHYRRFSEPFTLLQQGTGNGLYRHLLPGRLPAQHSGKEATISAPIVLKRRTYLDKNYTPKFTRYTALEQNGINIHG